MREDIDTPKGPVAVIVVAAGRGTRMGIDQNKVFLDLAGIPVLARTFRAFSASGLVERFVAVVGEQEKDKAKALLAAFCPGLPVEVVAGGADRQASVYQGLLSLWGDETIVLVHDGARPFVPTACIEACVNAAREFGAACVGMPVKDTIKRVDATGDVVETPDRERLWQVQTPQGFAADVLLRAHERALGEGFRGTDDASLVERLGLRVRMVAGAYANIKLTTAEDLAFAEALLGKEL